MCLHSNVSIIWIRMWPGLLLIIERILTNLKYRAHCDRPWVCIIWAVWFTASWPFGPTTPHPTLQITKYTWNMIITDDYNTSSLLIILHSEVFFEDEAWRKYWLINLGLAIKHIIAFKNIHWRNYCGRCVCLFIKIFKFSWYVSPNIVIAFVTDCYTFLSH